MDDGLLCCFDADEQQVLEWIVSTGIENVFDRVNDGSVKMTHILFKCIVRVCLGNVLRTLPRSTDLLYEAGIARGNETITGEIDVDTMYGLTHVNDVLKDGSFLSKVSLKLIVAAMRKTPRKAVEGVFDTNDIYGLIRMIRSDDPKERMHICQVIIGACLCSTHAAAIKLAVFNEIVSFIEGMRVNTGIDDLLKIMCVIVSEKKYESQEVYVFYFEAILKLAGSQRCQGVSQIGSVIRAFHREYPRLVLLGLKYFRKVFGVMCSTSKVMVVYVVSDVIQSMSHEKHLEMSDVIYELISLFFCSEHYLVIEMAADMVLANATGVLYKNRKEFIPKVFESVYRASKRSWHIECVSKVLRSLQAVFWMDNGMFEMCLKKYNKKRWESGVHSVDGSNNQ
ncbi:protein phosphatase 2A [Ordospora colligata]|nr:protein phosphatase 2A [Ordospora colligata]TBU18957.1 protein phosphatase 2A [Ordospora colligata]